MQHKIFPFRMLGVLFLSFTLIIFLAFSSLSTPSVFAGTTSKEVSASILEEEALEALYHSTDGDNWTDNTGWLVDPDPCNWYGVTCLGEPHESYAVIGLELENNNLNGPLPADIGDLGSLQWVELRDNSLSGNIPVEIGDIEYLETLDLSNNQLTGGIPVELSTLSDLYLLELSGNDLSGSIPPELGSMPSLEDLYLGDNQLTGTIPAELGSLSNLWGLDLSGNSLTGDITVLSGLTNLEYLDLSDSTLDLSMSVIESLSSLTMLYLSGNGLTGDIPSEIYGLTDLESLDLSQNQLTEFHPESFSDPAAFYGLYLSSNQISGQIPTNIDVLVDLNQLDLSYNELNGEIPSELGSMPLSIIDLSQNRLTGSIPSELGNLEWLLKIKLDNNALSGEIPTSLQNLSNLGEFGYDGETDFGYNKLYATDPDLISFLETHDPDWDETQTVPPSNVQITDLQSTSVELSWSPIQYTGDGGYYQVSYGTSSEGPYTVHGSTQDKAETGYVVDGLEADTDYYFVVRSYTPAHGFQKNDLWSAYSDEVSAAMGKFSDVSSDHWAFDWIEALSNAGLTSGYPDGTYRPGNPVTRAEMGVFLLKGMNAGTYEPPAPDSSHPFSDIAGHWAEDWMEELYDVGLTSGYPDGTYRPQNQVTRAEMAVFLLRAKHGAEYSPPAASGSAFSDVAGHWAEGWIEQLAEEGITGGYPDGTYRPNNPVTRAEMAVFLVRAFGLFIP